MPSGFKPCSNRIGQVTGGSFLSRCESQSVKKNNNKGADQARKKYQSLKRAPNVFHASIAKKIQEASLIRMFKQECVFMLWASVERLLRDHFGRS